MKKNIIISPKTKVGELLEAYPELEEVLMKMSPAFEKLRNPVLRKTVARVATLQQVAVIGGINVEDIVTRLRKEAGAEETGMTIENMDYLSGTIPGWVANSRIVSHFNATPIINSGGSPMEEILHRTSHMKAGEIFELETPFVPAPVIDMLGNKGFRTCCTRSGDRFITWFSR
jgi:hypothetical protein